MPRRSMYNRNVGRALTRASSRNADRFHIISRSGSWVVMKDGIERAEKSYVSKFNAVRYADLALRNGIVDQFVVHRRDGSIEKIKSRR